VQEYELLVEMVLKERMGDCDDFKWLRRSSPSPPASQSKAAIVVVRNVSHFWLPWMNEEPAIDGGEVAWGQYPMFDHGGYT
jgi:hypothetical protein